MRKVSMWVVLCSLLVVGTVLAAGNNVSLPKTEQVSGWVLDQAGEPIVDAQVFLALSKEKFETQSDEKGYFLITGVPKESGVLMIQKDGYIPQQVKFEIGSEELKISLQPVPSNPGFLAGQMLDAETGSGIWQVEVIAESQGFISVAKPPRTLTDAKGYWRLSLPPGKYLLTAKHHLYEEYKEQVEVIAGEVTTLSFKLIPKILPPAFVQGLVQTKGQRELFLMPVADARVILAMENQSSWETISDSSGLFRFPAVPPGKGLLMVTKGGYKPWQEKIQLKAGELAELQVFLEPLPVKETLLYGQVKDMKTGKPISFARIQAQNFDFVSLESRFVIADNQGFYRFFLAPGKYIVEAQHPEYIPRPEPVELFPGQNKKIDFPLRPLRQEPSTVVGKVYQGEPKISLPVEGRHNRSIAEAEVLLIGEEGEYKALSGPDGWFELPIVEPGRYKLIVRKERYLPYQRTITVPQGEKIELFIPLVPGNLIILD